jgi:hypothetical protein
MNFPSFANSTHPPWQAADLWSGSFEHQAENRVARRGDTYVTSDSEGRVSKTSGKPEILLRLRSLYR